MDSVVTVLLTAAFVVVPPILVGALYETRLYWLPGGGLLVLGAVTWAPISSTSSGPGGVGALASGGLAIAGLCSVVYGLIWLAVAALLHENAMHSTARAGKPPRAIVVRGVPRPEAGGQAGSSEGNAS
jgi:hypothetical protein